MVRSRMPVPSLLCLFGALLMLSPELFMGIPEGLSEVPVTDPGVQEALGFAVEKYNQERGDSGNYFKQLRLLKPLLPVEIWQEYHLMVELVETACKKSLGWRMKYKNIQTCKQLPVNPKKLTCYFNVEPPYGPFQMNLALALCT